MRNGAPFSKPRVRLYGETGDAQQYLGAAYNLLYKVRQLCEASGAPVFSMQRSLADGAVVQAAILGNEEIVSCFPPTYVRGDSPRRRLLSDVVGGYIVLPSTPTAPDGWPGETHGSPRHYIKLQGEGRPPKFLSDTPYRADPVVWRGVDDKIVTYWHGGSSRYAFGDLDQITAAGANNLHILGCVVNTDGRFVVGAGLFGAWLLIVARDVSGGVADDALWAAVNPYNDLLAAHISGDPVPATLAPAWMKVGDVPRTEFARYTKPWFFAPTGGRAATVQRDWLSGSLRSFVARIDISVDEATGLLVMDYSRDLYDREPMQISSSATGLPPDSEPTYQSIGYMIGPWVETKSVADGMAELVAGMPDDTASTSHRIEEITFSAPPTVSGELIYDNTFAPYGAWISWVGLTIATNTASGAQTLVDMAYGGIYGREAIALYDFYTPYDSLRYYAEGSDLVAVDYDAGAGEVLIELRPVEGKEQTVLRWHGVRRMAPFVSLSPGEFDIINSATAFEHVVNGAPIPPTLAHGCTHGGYWRPGTNYSKLFYTQERTTLRTQGALAVEIAAGGDQLHVVEIEDGRLLCDYSASTDIDIAVTAEMLGFPAYGVAFTNYPFEQLAPTKLEGHPVVDADAYGRSCLYSTLQMDIQITGMNYSGGQVRDIAIARPGTFQTRHGFRLRGADIDLGAASQPSDPQALTAPFGPTGALMWHYTYTNAVVALTFETIANTTFGMVSGTGVRGDQCAIGLYAVRDATSVVLSLETSAQPIRRVIYTEFNGATFDSVSELDVPTADALRIYPIYAI